MKKAIDQTLRDIKRGVNKTVLKVPSIEQKVLDATSNEPWGPHGSVLADIAQATRNYHEYQIIMSVLWKRINDIGKNWRHVYKVKAAYIRPPLTSLLAGAFNGTGVTVVVYLQALTVLEYMVAHGSERVIDDIKEHAYQISTLSDFQYIDSGGRDQGNNVRRKSQTLVALVNDKEMIQEVREKAANNRDKFRSSSAMGGMYRPGSGGYGDDRYEGRYGGRDDDRNGYGREKDDERYGRYGDSYSREGDSYKGYESRGKSRSEDGYQHGSRSRSSERVGDRAYDEDDRHSSRGSSVKPDDQHIEGRRLERKFSEQNLGGPPSYEEAVNVSKSPAYSERDGETPTATSAQQSSPPVGANAAQSSPIADATPQPSPAPNNVSPSQAAAEDGVAIHSHVPTDSFDEFDPRGSVSAVPSTSHKAEVDLFGSLSDAFAPGPLAIVPASFGISDSTSSATTSENTVPNQSFVDPFGESPFKAFPSAKPALPNNFASTTSFQPSVITLEHTKSSSSNQQFPDSFPGTYNPDNASNGQSPPNQHFFSGEQSMQRNDVLAGILPPSASVATSASQSDFPAPTGQQAFATSTPFPVTPPQNLTVQPGGLTRHSSLPYFDTSVNSSTNIGFQPPSRMSSLPSDDLLGGLVGQSGSSSYEGPLALVPHRPSEKKFETKSTVWTDTLNRGLVNLNISGSKINPLSNIGVDFESLNRKEKRMEKPSTTLATSSVSMGKAMGSGSGIGRAGSDVPRPAQNPMEPGMGMGGMNMGMGRMVARPGVGMGMGNYGTMNVNQRPMGIGGMGMGMGMNMGGMGMNMVMGQGVPVQPPMQPPHGLAPGSNMNNYPMAGRGGYPPQQTYQYGGGYR